MSYTAFSGFDHLASGSLAEVYAASRDVPGALIFDQETGRVVDIDPRYPPSDETARPGRPKLGVVAREVTLLPRHWDWLAAQPGGASVALRKLVEEARSNPRLQMRAARDSLYRFITAMVGNAPAMKKRSGRFMPASARNSSPISKPGRPISAPSWKALMRRPLSIKNPRSGLFSPSRHSGWAPGLWDRRVPAAGDAGFSAARRASASCLARFAASAMRAAIFFGRQVFHLLQSCLTCCRRSLHQSCRMTRISR